MEWSSGACDTRNRRTAKWPPTKPRETRDTVMRRRGCVARNREEEEKKEKTRPRWTKKSDSLFGRRRFFLLFFRECCDDYVLGGEWSWIILEQEEGIVGENFCCRDERKVWKKGLFWFVDFFFGGGLRVSSLSKAVHLFSAAFCFSQSISPVWNGRVTRIYDSNCFLLSLLFLYKCSHSL